MADNIHATAVVLGDRGIVIMGESGAGKTHLALASMSRAAAQGLFARLVADDQLFLEVHHGLLLCTAPESIAGLAEVRGVGPAPLACEPAAPVDLVVRLVDRQHADRFPEPSTERLLGCEIPLLRLASHDRDAAVTAIMARLSFPPFGSGG